MAKIHYMEQGTNEWFSVRLGKMTASNAQAIGAGGKGLNSYIYEVMAEYFSSAEKERFENEHTERGNLLEQDARDRYEQVQSVKVDTVGFIEYNEYSGCSPDGLVGEDGLVEIKCKSDVNYLHYLMDGIIDTKYVWQMQMQMLITGRTWCDYVVYNPNFEKDIIITRVIADTEKQEDLKKGLLKGELLINLIKKEYKNSLKVS